MKEKFWAKGLALGCIFILSMVLVATAFAGEYDSLQGVDSIKAVFDFRDGVPASANVHLKLAHMTFQDKNLRQISDPPKFAVVFMGSAVKLLSSNRDGYSAEDKKALDEMTETIKAMAKDRIQLEVCMFAVNFFKVDPATLPPEIKQVGNGWVSSIAYQAQGYGLVPVF